MKVKKIYFNRKHDQWVGDTVYIEDELDAQGLHVKIMDVEFNSSLVSTIMADFRDSNGGVYSVKGTPDYDKRIVVFKIPLQILSNDGLYEVVFSISYYSQNGNDKLIKTAIQTFTIRDTIESDDEAIQQETHYPILVDLVNEISKYKVDVTEFIKEEDAERIIIEKIDAVVSGMNGVNKDELKEIFSCDKNVSFLSTGNVATTNCYTNTGGDLDEIPVAWGGHGFDKSVTSIYVIDTTLLSNTMTFNLVDSDSQVGITNWGDGIVSTEKSHTYREHGIYTIKTKSCPNGVAPHDDVKNALIEVKQIKLIGHKGNTQSYSHLFNGCKNLRKVTTYNLAPSDCSSMFQNCSSLTEIVGMDTWDMSSCINMNSMFQNCSSLTEIIVDTWNTSSCDEFQQMFLECNNLKAIKLNMEIGANCVKMFTNCTNLERIDVNIKPTVTSNLFRGCVNINYVRSIDFDYTTYDNDEGLGWSTYNTALKTFNILGTLSISLMNIHGFTGLTVDGIMEFIYALKDYSGVSETHTLGIGSTNIAKLTDEQIAIATNKGWTLS